MIPNEKAETSDEANEDLFIIVCDRRPAFIWICDKEISFLWTIDKSRESDSIRRGHIQGQLLEFAAHKPTKPPRPDTLSIC